MADLLHSIMTKLTAGFLVLVILITGLTFLFTVGAATEKIQESTKQELLAIASITSSDLNGDEIAKLQPGMEASTLYLMNVEQLAGMAGADHEIVKIFTIHQNGDQYEYVLDSGYNTGNRDFRVGTPVTAPSRAMIMAFENPQVEEDFVSRPWGKVLSGYAPIQNAMGKVIGIVGVDMDAKVVQNRMNVVSQTIYIVLILGIICTGLIIAVFSRTMIRDIRTLIESADRISKGDTNVSITILRTDEIGELASSFKRMITSLKILMHQDYQQE